MILGLVASGLAAALLRRCSSQVAVVAHRQAVEEVSPLEPLPSRAAAARRREAEATWRGCCEACVAARVCPPWGSPCVWKFDGG